MGTVVLLFSCEAVTSFKMRYLVGLISFLWILNLTHAKDGKLLPFQIIKFPNDPCDVSSTKNGTCYTSEECSDKGGTSIGSCAEGYGVCCTFSIGCGGSSSENCTYVEISSPSAGMCNAQICPTTINICQIRLDFDTFVITGPSTVTVSVGLFLGGEGNVAGVAQMDRGQCKSDTFAISNAPHIPVVCGTLTGEHMYIDASTDCNNLEFVFGQTAVGLTTLATRSITIKASQLACGDSNLAPSGCSQYYWGTGGASTIKSFGYDGSTAHLANQAQTVCVRRESGNCQICWYAASNTDVSLSGMSAAITSTKTYKSAIVKDSLCCGYGADGKNSAWGYDCLMIPGAVKGSSPYTVVTPVSMCGQGNGLAYSTGTYKTTATPDAGQQKNCLFCFITFRISFFSDGLEQSAAADGVNSYGFKLSYFQRSC